MGARAGRGRRGFSLIRPALVLVTVLLCCAATCEGAEAERLELKPPPANSAPATGDSAPIPWSTLFQGAIMALVAWTYKSVRDHEILLARLDERLRTMDATDKRLRVEIDRLLSARESEHETAAEAPPA